MSSGKDPEAIVQDRGLKQMTDDSEIRNVIVGVLQSHPSQLADYVAGNVRLFPFFVGQVMKATKGSANPKLVNEILTEELKNRTGEA